MLIFKYPQFNGSMVDVVVPIFELY